MHLAQFIGGISSFNHPVAEGKGEYGGRGEDPLRRLDLGTKLETVVQPRVDLLCTRRFQLNSGGLVETLVGGIRKSRVWSKDHTLEHLAYLELPAQ